MNCASCGMPMKRTENHSQGDIKNRYCRRCAPDGKLRSRRELREGLIDALMDKEKINKEEAKRKVDKEMSKIPSWKKRAIKDSGWDQII